MLLVMKYKVLLHELQPQPPQKGKCLIYIITKVLIKDL